MPTEYQWYPIFSLVDFVATGLVSRTLTLLLDRGMTVFEIFRGNTVAVMYADVFLPVNFLSQNPYVQETYAVYVDTTDAQTVWFGFQVT